jgi:hypothetical protein
MKFDEGGESSLFLAPEIRVDLIESHICKLLIKTYGLTDNPGDAGFILPDGSLFDCSGAKFGNRWGGRNIDHHEIANFQRKFDSRHYGMLYVMFRSGLIRIAESKNTNVVDSVGVPNAEQRRTIREIFSSAYITLRDTKHFDILKEEELDEITYESLLAVYRENYSEIEEQHSKKIFNVLLGV